MSGEKDEVTKVTTPKPKPPEQDQEPEGENDDGSSRELRR